MIAALLAIALAQAVGAEPRPLLPHATFRGNLAGGESALFSIAIPADHVARVVVRQEGVDVSVTLRPDGVALEHGLDFTSGTDGEERAFASPLDTPTRWTLRVAAVLPRAVRGDYAIDLDARTSRRPTARRRRRVSPSPPGVGHGMGWGRRRVSEGSNRICRRRGRRARAGDTRARCRIVLSMRAHSRQPRRLSRCDRAPTARARRCFDSIGRRDREARVLNRLGDLSRKIGEVSTPSATSSRRFRSRARSMIRSISPTSSTTPAC